MFNDLIPMLICRDVQESLRFYRDVLGFRVRGRMDDVGRNGWASIECGKAALMLASPTYIPVPPLIEGRNPQAIHYFYPRDLDAVRRRVIDAGWPAGEIEERFYGMREFEVVDPSGHVLCFGQDVPEQPDGTSQTRSREAEAEDTAGSGG